jgi:hypothetical protein
MDFGPVGSIGRVELRGVTVPNRNSNQGPYEDDATQYLLRALGSFPGAGANLSMEGIIGTEQVAVHVSLVGTDQATSDVASCLRQAMVVTGETRSADLGTKGAQWFARVYREQTEAPF